MSIERKQFLIWLAIMSAAARKVFLVAMAGSVTYIAMSAAPVVPFAQQLAPSKPAPLIAVEPTKTPAPKIENKAGTSDQTDAAIAAMIVQESRNAYYATGHPCACPDDLMRNGRRCGGTSAYIRPGGAHPLCSAADVSPEMVRQYRARAGRN
jgi:hypothetical protein